MERSILFLGNEYPKMINFLKEESSLVSTNQKITIEEIEQIDPQFIVVFGYRHILNKEIVRKYFGNIVNLHISYLPWNRGADPNFWSFLEHTPKGVTIHFIDEGIDTGEILFQKVIDYDCNDTLELTYESLIKEMIDLFIEKWHLIKKNNVIPCAQAGDYSFHKKKDKDKYVHLLEKNGWKTKVSEIEKYGEINKLFRCKK